MKILYTARMARYDLLRATQYLATRITKWTQRCDKQLHRLVAYIWQSKDWRLKGWIGDDMKDLQLWMYTDSDFASDKSDSKSVSGIFMAIGGATTYFPNHNFVYSGTNMNI